MTILIIACNWVLLPLLVIPSIGIIDSDECGYNFPARGPIANWRLSVVPDAQANIREQR